MKKNIVSKRSGTLGEKKVTKRVEAGLLSDTTIPWVIHRIPSELRS
jgi:hypothetical protein